MSVAVETERDRQVQYGNLRRTKLPGLGRLSAAASVILLVGAAGLILLVVVNIWLAAVWTALIAVMVAPELVPTRDGYSRYAKTLRFLRHRSARSAGRTVLRQGLTGHVPDGQCRLPGLAAASELSTHHDVHGREFGLVSWPHANQYAVCIQTFPPGLSGQDKDVVDDQVAQWGAWLAQLNTIGEVAGAAVVVETAPDSGQRLARSMARGRSVTAPAFSQQVAAEKLQRRQIASPTVTTRIAVTFSAKPAAGAEGHGEERVRTRAEMADVIGDVLPTLTGTLDGTGAGTGSYPCTAQDMTDLVRVAYDPDVAALVEEAQFEGGTGLSWDQAGPISADNRYDTYAHDGAISRTWQMREAPRGMFFAQTLGRLLAPHKDVARKRVTLLYRPESPERSASLAENDVKAATFMATQNARARAAHRVALQAAEKTAEQEALGSPLIRVGLLVTVTVLDEQLLPRASRAVVSVLSPQARLRLRLPKGGQDAAFVAALPLGLVPPAYLGVPDAVRSAL